MKLVLATGNNKKVEEFKRILAPLGIEIIPQSVLAPDLDVVEDGATFEANAYLKAKALYDQCKLPTIADDSGLCVDALDGAPGVLTARYAGEACDSEDNIAFLLKNMKGVPRENRTGTFVCAIVAIMDDDTTITVKGESNGWIAFEKHGDNGFGYDPVFMVGDESFANMSHEDKDKISHRGKATRMMTEKLKNYMDGDKNNANE